MEGDWEKPPTGLEGGGRGAGACITWALPWSFQEELTSSSLTLGLLPPSTVR